MFRAAVESSTQTCFRRYDVIRYDILKQRRRYFIYLFIFKILFNIADKEPEGH